MKKIFNFMMIALVAMVAFTSCSDDCNHEYIEVDYSKKLAGIWTCIEPENAYAEALVINADGSVTSTGVFDGQLWEKKGTFKVKGNKMTLSYEDGDYLETRFEMVEGEVFSLVDDYLDVRYNYYYCENDLSDEILGMWVCHDTPAEGENEMMIETFYENGKSTLTGFLPLEGGSEQVLNDATDYKVIGDLLFITVPAEKFGGEHPFGITHRLTYSPNATKLGDIITMTAYAEVEGEYIAGTSSWLRVKQYLNLVDKVYDYSSAYVTNAKGKDENFTITGKTFNMANIKAGDFDMMFRSVLSCFEFSANSFKYRFRLDNGQESAFETPITVEGNKVTLDMSGVSSTCRKVDMYMFQDADDSQLHIYMPTSAFINYFANLDIIALVTEGKIDPTDAAAIEKVYTDMEARVESINVSFVMKARN